MRGLASVIRTHRSRRGFTAVEMSMVVTVIAILALLILPLFQKQTEEARLTAAEGDIREMAIAMQLVNAHTERWFTLSSLDNTDNYNTTTVRPDIDVPLVTWNDALTAQERANLVTRWQGPYMSYRRSISADELFSLRPEYFRWQAGAPINGGLQGPINQQVNTAFGGVDFGPDRIPLDPWGNPYIFYGPDYYHLPTGVGGAFAPETRFRNTLFVSFGPNGFPGDLPGPVTAIDLMRESGFVGTGDDVFRVM